MIQEASIAWFFSDVLQAYKVSYIELDEYLERKLNLKIDTQRQSVQLPKCRVPLALMEPLKEELISLTRRGIIKSVEISTNWITNLVVVRKTSSKWRLCINPRPLNRVLKRSHYPLLTVKDILDKLLRAKGFMVLEVKNGFWHIELDDPSSHLIILAMSFGR